MAELFQDEGRAFEGTTIFFYNIYLGGKFFRFDENGMRSHICRKMPFELMFAVFHEIERGSVLKSESEYITKLCDSCITIIWTAEKPEIEQVEAGFFLADDIARGIELATGYPCPLPLSRLQLPSAFEIGWHVAGTDRWSKIIVQGNEEERPILSMRIAPILHALQGFSDEYNDLIKLPPYSIVDRAARWQQKAIRSFGLGEWSDSIVSAATWVEVFVVQMTLEINKILSTEINDPRSALARGLPKFINLYLGAKHLKGKWDHLDNKTVFGKLYSCCQEARNRVVHLGEFPNRSEALAAYDAAHEFVHLLTREIGKLKDPRIKDFVALFKEMSQRRMKTQSESS